MEITREDRFKKLHVKKDDLVMIIAGKDKGKKGKVLRVVPKKKKVFIEGLNIIHKHTKPNNQMQQGGIIEKEAPLNISNVLVVCPKCDKPVRNKRKLLEDGKRVRICVKCEEILDIK